MSNIIENVIILNKQVNGFNIYNEEVGDIEVEINGEVIKTHFYEMKDGYISLVGFVGRYIGEEKWQRAVTGIKSDNVLQFLPFDEKSTNVEYKFDLSESKKFFQNDNFNKYYLPKNI